MLRLKSSLALLTTALFSTLPATNSFAQSGLSVTYGGNGIQTLSYAGVTLEDLNAFPGDVFHIWHMKVTDLSGNLLTGGPYGWGEAASNRQFNQSNNTWIYSFPWGTINVQFYQDGDTLDTIVTTTNYAGSGVIVDGATIYPFVLHFPMLPYGFTDPSYPQIAYNTIAPSVSDANYGSGQVVAVVNDPTRPVYSGFFPATPANAYFPIISSTSPDFIATFLPHNDRPVSPGQTDIFAVSLRFSPPGGPLGLIAADAYSNWAAAWPAQLNWTDRRAIGTIYLASSPQGDPTQPAGFPTNPRRYFNDSGVDVTTPAGLAAFQHRMLQQAANNVANMKQLNAQGGITWDIEGEQYPLPTSYTCAPDLIATLAPEMETTINDGSSPYNGMKLDDAYFRTMTDAGLRVGVCVRPQHLFFGSNGYESQSYLPDSMVLAELQRKMLYAHNRWGATIFYVDTTVEPDGQPLDASMFQQLAAMLPDSLIIPEESTPKYYAYTAPFQTFFFHGEVGTDNSVYSYYPRAFSANLINDVDPTLLAAAIPQLTASVRRGDILMVHADYWQANNPTIVQIYQSAGVTGGGTIPPVVTPPVVTPPVVTPPVVTPPVVTPPVVTPPVVTPPVVTPPVVTPPVVTPPVVTPPVVTPPVVTPPVVTPPSPPASSQVSILSPGASQSVSGTITVTAEIDVQLDAAGSHLTVDGNTVPHTQVSSGPYVYPLDTTTLPNGQHSLQIWTHDTNNDVILSGVITVNVAN